MVIRMLTKLRRRKEELSENFNKDLENKKNQPELKYTITEIKNILEEISSR